MNELGRRKSMIGVVISNKMEKTAVVAVERRRPHPLYRKIVRSTKHYKAHDPNNAAKLGDVVRIVETRPLSKDKRWRIAETLVRGDVAEVAPREIGAPEELLAVAEPEAPAAAAPAEEPPEAQVEAPPVAEAEARDEPEAPVEAPPEAEAESSDEPGPEPAAEEAEA